MDTFPPPATALNTDKVATSVDNQREETKQRRCEIFTCIPHVKKAYTPHL